MKLNEDDLFYANAPCRSCSTDLFHCVGGEVEGTCIKMDRWMQLKNYVDKLKKENGRLKRKIEYDQTMTCTRGRMIDELQEGLQAKDRALDKAIDEIMSYQTLCPPTDYNDCKNEKQWKEFFEDETN